MQLDLEESTPASDRLIDTPKLLQNTCTSILNCGPVTFCPVLILVQSQTDRRTDRQSDAYEPTMHKHRCVQKLYTIAFYESLNLLLTNFANYITIGNLYLKIVHSIKLITSITQYQTFLTDIQKTNKHKHLYTIQRLY